MITLSLQSNSIPHLRWRVPQDISDELVLPARIAFRTPEGNDLRRGELPGITESNGHANGCFNFDTSKTSHSLTLKYQNASALEIGEVRKQIFTLLHEASTVEDIQFQFRQGVDWRKLCKQGDSLDFTVVSVRHLDDNERLALATDLMSFKIHYYFLSRSQLLLYLNGHDMEVLRNLVMCTTAYIPFGQRQQSTQVSLTGVKKDNEGCYLINVTYSPMGSMPMIPLQILRGNVAPHLNNQPVATSALGKALEKRFNACRFEYRTVVEDDNTFAAMIVFWARTSDKDKFPQEFLFTDSSNKEVKCIIEHCGNLLPQAGAPGEPPRHETKKEHWKKVGETLNPSFKNRLTVIAPVSSHGTPQKRRFGLLREAYLDCPTKRVFYTYAETFLHLC